MTEVQSDGVAEHQVGDQSQESQSSVGDVQEVVISESDHKRALSDMHKYKSQARETKQQLDSLARELERIKQESLKKNEDFKTLYEQTEEQLQLKNQEVDKLRGSVLYNERYRAVLPELQKLGLREDAASLLEMQSLDEVEVEATSSGRFICNGAGDYAKIFKAKHPYAFKEKSIGNVNSSSGGGAPVSKDVSVQDVLAAEKQFKAGKITREAYENTYRAYKKLN